MSDNAWTVEYRQTPEERFDTDMNARAEALVAERGGTVTGSDGGTSFVARADGRTSDNTILFTAPDVTAAKRVRDALAEHLGREVMLTDCAVTDPEPFNVEDEAEYEEPPGPTLAERAQNAKDAVGWADQNDQAAYNSALWDFVKVATDAVAEVHRLRAEVDRLKAALPAFEEPGLRSV